MHTSLKAAATACFLIACATSANATPMSFVAHLSGAGENPPTGSPGTGTAVITLDALANTMEVNVNFTGLTLPDTAAHIHCCLGTPFGPGNAGVATPAPSFPGFPLNVTSGSYDVVLDMTLSSSYLPGFLTANSGSTALAEATLFNGITAGEAYFNIHTPNFPGGEIRGFLVATPEPATIALFGFSVAALGLKRRRRQRS